MALRRALAAVFLLLFVIAAPVQAADKPATCEDLQTVLDGAADGDVITLDSSDGVGGVCHGHYTLKSFPDPAGIENYKVWQLQGDPTNGVDGFTGADLTGSQRMLTGTDVHRFELWNLTFRHGDVTGDGGAIDITGQSSLGLRLSEFYDNHASGKGGAVHLAQETQVTSTLGGFGFSGDIFGSETTPALGNSAATGGAVSIESPGTGNNNSGINGSTFGNNTATGNGGGFDYAIPPGTAENFSLNGNVVVKNKAGGSGGGGHVVVANTSLRVDNERYEDNSV